MVVTARDAATARRGSAADGAAIGGKAAGLERLRAAGARVPDWVVLPVELFERHLRDSGIDPGAPDAQWRIRESPAGASLDAAVAAAIARLGPGPFAVRSSMVGEDGAQYSWAGQLETFLWRRTAAEVRDAVLGCWASALAPRALAYRARIGTPGAPRVAVIVQRMVVGDASGVAFSADAVTGRAGDARVAATFGLGEGLVSGDVDADEYLIGEDGREREASVADKDRMVLPDDARGGTRIVPVPADRRRQRVLPPARAEAIAREARRLEARFGHPLDVEWTLEGDTLWLLQARAITAGAREAPAAPTVWDNSNIQESYCGVTTPLTFSFALRAYASVYEQTMRALGLRESVIAAHRGMLLHLLGLVRGRVYYNINNWYRGLLLLPSFRRNKEDMERMMGLEEPVEFIAEESGGWLGRLRRLPRMVATGLRLLRRFRRLEHDVPAFLDRFDRAMAAVGRDRLHTLDAGELIAVADRLEQDVLRRWEEPILNDFLVMMRSGELTRIVARAAPDSADSLLQSLLGNVEGLESAEPARLLMRIAARVRETPVAREAMARLNDGTLDAAATMDRLHRAAPAIAGDVETYLARYGDRGIGELKLETVTPRQDPTFVLRVIHSYAGRPDLDPDALGERERVRRVAAERAVEDGLPRWRRARFRRALEHARQGIRDRERMRLARTRLFGLYRDLYLALGERLRERGSFETARDVFWLTVDELRAAALDPDPRDLRPLVAARRAEFAGYEMDEPPNRVMTARPADDQGIVRLDSGPAPAGEPRASTGNLRGTGCCAGVVEAPVRIVMSASDDPDLSGRILVTLRTDPGWGPLFPVASGILVERGSTLSHSAVLARELGIPAIVGIPGLLRTLRDGERVRMDGASGVIERLDP